MFNDKYKGQYNILEAPNFKKEFPNPNYQQDDQRELELRQKIDEIEGQRKAHLEKLKQGTGKFQISTRPLRQPKVRFSDQFQDLHSI